MKYKKIIEETIKKYNEAKDKDEVVKDFLADNAIVVEKIQRLSNSDTWYRLGYVLTLGLEDNINPVFLNVAEGVGVLHTFSNVIAKFKSEFFTKIIKFFDNIKD